MDKARLAYQLAAGEFELAVFTPFPYLKAKLDFPELEVFASHVVRGGETYRGAIIVRADSTIETLDDLAGKTLLFVRPTSTSGKATAEELEHLAATLREASGEEESVS